MSNRQRNEWITAHTEQKDLSVLNSEFEHASPDVILKWSYEEFGTRVVMGTGFGSSGVVLMHYLSELGLPVQVFTLDTGLLFDQTYKLWKTLERKLRLKVERVSPILTLSGQKNRFGENLWQIEPDKCCHIRKVLPLKKYLSNKEGWITGLRRSQSEYRESTRKIEWDATNQVYKINPLADWDQEEIWWYINKHDLPYNPLHDEGFPSIGCFPCTSPVEEGEDERAGRWKNLQKTECGIHVPDFNPAKRSSAE